MEIIFVYTESMTNPVRAAEVFAQMREMGATGVCFHAYEQDLPRWPKDVPRIHEAAARAGLRRYISPARLGGMMAGLYSMPDVYTHLHPECIITPIPPPNPRSTLGLSARMACVNDPGFRQYAQDYVDGLMRDLGPDGLLIDEPQGLSRSIVCECPRCAALVRPDETPADAQRRSRIDFLSRLCAKARERRPSLRISLLASIGDEGHERFDLIARIEPLDAIAVEPYWALIDRDLAWLRVACDNSAKHVRRVSRELDIWALNFAITAGREVEIPEAFRIIAAARPDAIWTFWWWRACDDPATVMQRTREGIASILA